MRKVTLLVVVLALLVGFIVPNAYAQDEMEKKDIVDTAVEDGRFTVLAAALEAAGLVEALKAEGPFTVFAPTDAAFAAALEELSITAEDLLADPAALSQILLYHVVPGAVMAEDAMTLESAATLQGSSITLSTSMEMEDTMETKEGLFLNGGAEVFQADIEATNGVIHVIDAVILPPAEGEMEGSYAGGLLNIVEIAAADENFSTLVAAVTAAELGEALSAPGPYTVFAPTNDAFAAAFEALGIAPEDLLADTETLTGILLYHVVSGEAYAEEVVNLAAVTTLQGSDITIAVKDDGVYLNDTVRVSVTDIAAQNGVIHVIDGVLLPPAE